MFNIRSIKIASSLILAATVTAVPATAQDTNARPNFGTVTLRTGFTPDPRVIAVQSGGNIDMSRVSGNCPGFISSAPDVRLNFTGGGSLPLIISANSRADTTLVINGPDGRWYCDDDGGTRGMNPAVRFNHPATGRYEIWIGTYGGATLQPAQLHISEISSQ